MTPPTALLRETIKMERKRLIDTENGEEMCNKIERYGTNKIERYGTKDSIAYHII